jgi:hypothetical protein
LKTRARHRDGTAVFERSVIEWLTLNSGESLENKRILGARVPFAGRETRPWKSRLAGNNVVLLDKAKAKNAASWPFTSERARSQAEVEERQAAAEGLKELQKAKRQEIRMADERAQSLGRNEADNHPEAVKGTGTKQPTMPNGPNSVPGTGAQTSRGTTPGS